MKKEKKKFKVTYTETRSTTKIIEAKNGEEAYDKFHNLPPRARVFWKYYGEETEVIEIEKSK